MKKFYLLLAFFALLFFQFPKSVHATHYAACDLTYTCLGGNDYLITVTFFRDCSGVNPQNPISVNFKNSCGVNFNTDFPQIGNYANIATTCSSQATCCAWEYPNQPAGCLYGLRKFIYQKQVVLPPCTDWIISWASGSRNPNQSLVNPTGQNWYIYAKLNNDQSSGAPCNSSPQFSNYPSAVACVGQRFCYNHGALDPDGDSLVYSLTPPMQTATNPCTYMAAYSYTYPLPSAPPLSVDSVTGDVCMYPTQNFIGAFAIKVEEWRTVNGVKTLIGTIIRDMQVLIVNNCNNFIPTLAGINPAATQYNPADTNYFLDVCLGDSINFNVYPFDSLTVPPQNLTMTWNGGIPGGNWWVVGDGTPNPVGHFKWLPNASVVSNTAQCFTVNIKDDACPYIGQQTFSYCVTVKGLEVELDPPNDSLLCMGESYQIMALGDTNVADVNGYVWKVDGNIFTPTVNDSITIINSTVLGPGTHIISCEVNDGTSVVCPGKAQVTVKVIPMPDIPLPNDTLACQGQTVVLDAGPGQLYNWVPGGQNTQTIGVTSQGFYSVTVDGGYYTRCKDTKTVEVNFLTLPDVDLGPNLCITNKDTLFAHYPGFEFVWNGGPITGDSTYIVDDFGVNDISVIVSEKFGHQCQDTDIITVVYKPLPIIAISATDENLVPIAPGDIEMCSHYVRILTASKDENGTTIDNQPFYTYRWEPSGETTPSIKVTCLPEGSNNIKLYVIGCPGNEVMADRDIISKLCDLKLPNVFTPNDDQHNNVFKIDGIEGFPNSTLQVFDRWGKKIFESKNYNDANVWTGEGAAEGVYYYVLTVNYGTENNCMEARNYSGTVTILR